MSTRPERSSWRWSWGGRAVLVGLLLVVQGVASLHVVIVPHRRCAEHGELVEGSLPAGGGASGEGARAHASAPDGETPATHGDHDEHCVSCSLRAASQDAPGVGPIAVHQIAAVRAPEGTDRAKTSIPLFAIAPKSSPPTAPSKTA